MLRVVRKVPHPRYNSRTNDNDLMLLQLERPARLVLEWFAISFSRGSSRLRDQTQVSCTVGRFFTD